MKFYKKEDLEDPSVGIEAVLPGELFITVAPHYWKEGANTIYMMAVIEGNNRAGVSLNSGTSSAISGAASGRKVWVVDGEFTFHRVGAGK